MINTVIKSSFGVRLSVSEWDNDGVWMMINTDSSGISAVFTADELDQLITGLQAIQEATK